MIPFARPWITGEDRRAVMDVLSGPVLAHGPQAEAFEREFTDFLGGGYCVAVSSCAAALHLAYLAYGIGPGDEVIVPAMTHCSTANMVEWTGATCVFVDCDSATGNVTAEGIRAAITWRTKAIVVVHFVGIPCDMARISVLAHEHDLLLIEDCALAIGARVDGSHVGLFGDAGCFSFYPTKHITTGEGGMFVTRDAYVAEQVARMRAHGVERNTNGYGYDVPERGLNYRMGEMNAALGRSQLRRIDTILARRRENFEALQESIGPYGRVIDGPGSSHYCVVGFNIAKHNGWPLELMMRTSGEGLEVSVYYPHPVPRLAYYQNKYGAFDLARYPNAVKIADHSVALPVGPHVPLSVLA